MTEPTYSSVSQADMDGLTELVLRVGYAPIVAALGDILTQDPKVGMDRAPELSLTLGMTLAAAQEVDRLYPPGALWISE